MRILLGYKSCRGKTATSQWCIYRFCVGFFFSLPTVRGRCLPMERGQFAVTFLRYYPFLWVEIFYLTVSILSLVLIYDDLIPNLNICWEKWERGKTGQNLKLVESLWKGTFRKELNAWSGLAKIGINFTEWILVPKVSWYNFTFWFCLW